MDLRPVLEKLYPEGSYGGQCGTFAHRLVNFPPVGNSLKSKINSVMNFGIPAIKLSGGFQEGDVLITWESRIFGHVAVINKLIYAENTDNLIQLQLTESNYNLDLRVHHTRTLSASSPFIVGVIRGNLLFNV